MGVWTGGHLGISTQRRCFLCLERAGGRWCRGREIHKHCPFSFYKAMHLMKENVKNAEKQKNFKANENTDRSRLPPLPIRRQWLRP